MIQWTNVPATRPRQAKAMLIPSDIKAWTKVCKCGMLMLRTAGHQKDVRELTAACKLATGLACALTVCVSLPNCVERLECVLALAEESAAQIQQGLTAHQVSRR